MPARWGRKLSRTQRAFVTLTPKGIHTSKTEVSWKFFIDGSHCSKKTLQFLQPSGVSRQSAQRSIDVCENRRRNAALHSRSPKVQDAFSKILSPFQPANW